MASVTLEHQNGRWRIITLPAPQLTNHRLPLVIGECGSQSVAMHVWLALTALEAGE